MKNSLRKFNIKQNKKIKIDNFINKALYEPKIGYYSKKKKHLDRKVIS